MSAYQFGTLAFIPRNGDLRKTADQLRTEFDPESAQICSAHITVTQPFSFKPSDTDVLNIQNLLQEFSRFEIQVGPAVASPNKQLIWKTQFDSIAWIIPNQKSIFEIDRQFQLG